MAKWELSTCWSISRLHQDRPSHPVLSSVPRRRGGVILLRWRATKSWKHSARHPVWHSFCLPELFSSRNSHFREVPIVYRIRILHIYPHKCVHLRQIIVNYFSRYSLYNSMGDSSTIYILVIIIWHECELTYRRMKEPHCPCYYDRRYIAHIVNPEWPPLTQVDRFPQIHIAFLLAVPYSFRVKTTNSEYCWVGISEGYR